jgi:hypothetical protein
MDPDDPGESVHPHDGRARMRRLIEESRARYRLDELVGMPVAEARAIVETAGGIFATDDGPLNANFTPYRVVVSAADGRVIRADIG